MDLRELFKTNFPELVDNAAIRFDEPLNTHCSFKIGGPTEVYCEPNSIKQLIAILDIAQQHRINYFILGRGTNLLISDNGVQGLIINTYQLNKLSHDGNYISAYCGVSLSHLCQYALEHELTGLEFASGIPGSVGGAVYMNAGAYGGEVRDVLYCSKVLDPELSILGSENKILHLKAADHEFAYRQSVFQKTRFIHLSSVFKLTPAPREQIAEKMQSLEEQRNSKQPMDLPSAGSVFKRPEGYFTGQLIDECGLRGYRLGGAAVSDKHCGFIVNLGGATAEDVLGLIKYIQQSVAAKYGVHLEPELRFLGDL